MKNPNGYGSVFKMSGKRRNQWRVRKMTGRTPEGKPIYTNIGYAKTRAEGMQMLALFNENPYDVKAKNYTFKEMCEMYFESDKRDLAKNTLNGRNTNFKALKEIHDAPIRELKTIHLQETLDKIKGSRTTKRNIRSLMKRVFEYALQNDLITKNYASYVKVNPTEKPKPRMSFTNEEFLKVWNMETSLKADITKLLFFTGFRIKELLELKNADINLEEGYVRGGSKTEAGIDRIVPISKHISHLIEKYYDPSKEFLFEQKNNKPLPYVTYYVWFVKNVENHVIHDARHTFISMISDTEANKVSIQRIVGHASQGVTDKVYTHKNLQSLKEAMNYFDDYIGKIIN